MVDAGWSCCEEEVEEAVAESSFLRVLESLADILAEAGAASEGAFPGDS